MADVEGAEAWRPSIDQAAAVQGGRERVPEAQTSYETFLQTAAILFPDGSPTCLGGSNSFEVIRRPAGSAAAVRAHREDPSPRH